MAEFIAILSGPGNYTTVFDEALVKVQWKAGPVVDTPGQRQTKSTVLGARLSISGRQLLFELPRGGRLEAGTFKMAFKRWRNRRSHEATAVEITVQRLEEETVLRNRATSAIATSRIEFENNVTEAVDDLLGAVDNNG